MPSDDRKIQSVPRRWNMREFSVHEFPDIMGANYFSPADTRGLLRLAE
jgi:hypothetical protein